MKKILLITSVLLSLVFSVQAQVSYGVKAGLNMPTLTVGVENLSQTSDVITTFYVTAFADIPLIENLSLQPGLSFQNKGGKFIASDNPDLDADVTESLMYLELPVNVVYYVPTGNVGKVFFGAGPYVGLGVQVKDKQNSTTMTGSFNDASYTNIDAGLNLLAGYKLTNGLLFNAGYGLGLTNILKDQGNASMKN
ncbi:porin family protein [Sphingobacterium hungaricum]